MREVGAELRLPAELLERHPFPGPGLAIRCLCSEKDAEVQATEEGHIIPVRSVGVQGDSRSMRLVLAIERWIRRATTELTNRLANVNRVVAPVGMRAPWTGCACGRVADRRSSGAPAPGRCHRAALSTKAGTTGKSGNFR